MGQDIRELINKALSGDRYSIAKVITLIEYEPYKFKEFFSSYVKEVSSIIIGITGPPGVGKSTLINCLIRELRSQGRSVAVLAIDPSSPISGGALLGDRVRVRCVDEGVFFRSLSTPPNEEMPWKIYLIIDFLSMLNFDYIIIEQPGAGQINTKVSNITDVLIVILQPLLGDDIQMLKAGLTELGDIYVLNKADLPQAELYYTLVKPIIQELKRDDWIPPLVKVSSISCRGIKELVDAIDRFIMYSRSKGLLSKKKLIRKVFEVSDIVLSNLEGVVREVIKEELSSVNKEELTKKPVLALYEEVLGKVLQRICRCLT